MSELLKKQNYGVEVELKESQELWQLKLLPKLSGVR